MSNPYGITLDREWTEWAAKAGASPTVAAALHQVSRSRPPSEIVAPLTPGELGWSPKSSGAGQTVFRPERWLLSKAAL
jgi:hypothetical protein